MSEIHEPPDPFGLTPNLEAYVPRPATEHALEDLLRSVRDPDRMTALAGPPGLGKTLLLHLVAERLAEEFEPVYLPYAALPPDELAAWALGLLGSPPTPDPASVIRAYASHLQENGSGLLLVIDDAGSLPIASARWIGDWGAAAGAALRLAIAVTDSPSASRTIAAIGTSVDVIRLSDPMTLEETAEYVAARLALAQLPKATRERFGPEAIAELHLASGGIPRVLHAAASAMLRGQPLGPAGRPTRESVLVGLPLEEPSLPEALRGPTLDVADTLRVASPISEPTQDPGPREKAWRTPAEKEPFDTRSDTGARVGAQANADRAFDSGESRLPATPRRPETRLGPPPPATLLALGGVLVAAAALAIPTIRNLLPEIGSEAPAASRPVDDLPVGPSSPALGAPGDPPEEVAPSPPVAAPVPAQVFGSFAVQVNAVPWATIEIDGVALGETPLANVPLVAGEHRFRAGMPDGRVVERVVKIDADHRHVVFE